MVLKITKSVEPRPVAEAVHSALELAAPGDALSTFESQGFEFELAVDAELPIGDGRRECKGERDYVIDGVEVKLVGVTDVISADGTVWDYKTTERPDLERYANTMQWRSYLEIFGADVFRYIVFGISKRRKDGVYVVRSVDTLPLRRYPEMCSDVGSAVTEFTRFVMEHVPEYANRRSG